MTGNESIRYNVVSLNIGGHACANAPDPDGAPVYINGTPLTNVSKVSAEASSGNLTLIKIEFWAALGDRPNRVLPWEAMG